MSRPDADQKEADMAYRLGIDLGTTNTVASVAVDGALLRLVALGARSQHTRSMLYLAEDGQFVAGDTAADRGASDPTRLITDPRRQLGTDLPMIIGGQHVTPEQATAELINFVVGQATAEQHEPPSETVLSHPAYWNEYKVECFDRAIAAANLGSVRRCTNAEATVATHSAREPLSDGQRVAVYDLGGGSCEVTVLEKTFAGSRILGASEGADHPSGTDFDEAVFRLMLSNLGDRGHDLEQDNADSRRRLAEVKRACTLAKEALSTAVEAQIPVSLPRYSTTVRLGRQEFASLVRPALRESVAMTARVLSAAGVQARDLAAIVLVGGCCRMPVVAELLQREFKVRIALGTHPEYDLALGNLLVQHTRDGTAGVPPVLSPNAALFDGEAEAPAEEAEALVEEAQAGESEAAEESTTVGESALPDEARPDEEVPKAQQSQPERLGVATISASAAPSPGPDPPALMPDETMPNHHIFDHVTSADSDADDNTRVTSLSAGGPPSPEKSPSLPPWAQASVAVPSARSVPVESSPSVQRAQYAAKMASSERPIGQHQPGGTSGPGSFPSPGQYPPGQYPQQPRAPASHGPWTPNYPGSPSSPYGQWGSGGPGGYPPGRNGTEPDPGESRLRLFLIIVGVVVLVSAAVVAGVLISRLGEPNSTTSPGASLPQKLPSSSAIPKSVVVVPMRRGGGPDRPLYLIDTEAKIKPVELPTPGGGNSNPMMEASRNTIIYANAGKLRVMATDGSGDRKLFNRDPAGCARVEHTSWSLADPNLLLISCRISKTKVSLLVVGMDGKLIRRLDAGAQTIGDATLSPDGQTVLYWASTNPKADGGAFYTLPIIGTGAPKQLSKTVDGVDADPAWSPNGSQIAFRRRVPNGTIGGNEDVFVMNADGSGAHAMASTPAADFKPVWSPDSKNLLIISNRTSGTGGPGKTFDLWLVRERDGKVLRQLGLKAKQITQPFWTLR
jgi:molecular chaperone DnaK